MRNLNSLKHYKFTEVLKRLRKNNTLYLTISSPANRNALSKKLVDELEGCVQAINSSESQLQKLRSLVLQSDDPTIFCAGADLKERVPMSTQQVREFVFRLREVFDKFSKLEIPTIALINGFALGGGLELALACDMRYATKKSVLGLTETSLGIIPGAGGTQRLTKLIGIGKAKELIYTAARVTAEESLKIGLLNGVEDDETLLKIKVDSLIDAIEKNGPLALKAAKQAIDGGNGFGLSEGLKVEERCYDIVLHSEDRIEGLKAFIEKRKAQFKGV